MAQTLHKKLLLLILVMSILFTTSVCADWVYTNHSNRINWRIQPNGTEISHVLEPLEINLSAYPGILNSCKNHSLINCSDLIAAANDSATHFFRLLHNITFYNNTGTAWLTIILPNTTATGITALNYTLWTYSNATSGDNSVRIYEDYDEFDGGINSRLFVNHNLCAGTACLNNTIYRGVLGKQSMTNLPGTSQETIKTAAITARNVTVLFSIYGASILGNRTAAWGQDLGEQVMTKCGASKKLLGATSDGEVCNGFYNITVENVWRQVKFTRIGMPAGNTPIYIDGGYFAGKDTVRDYISQFWIGDAGNSGDIAIFDRFRTSKWNLSFYENDTTINNDSIEQIPGHVFNITLNEPANATSITANSLIGFNGTIQGSAATYDATLQINGAPNATISNIANNTKPEFNISLNATGTFTWSINATSVGDIAKSSNYSINNTFTITTQTLIRNATYNLTSAIMGEFNYTFTFNFSPAGGMSECWALLNGNQLNGTNNTEGICSINASVPQNITSTVIFRGNDSTNTVYSGTNTTLIKLFRDKTNLNTSQQHNWDIQHLFIEYRLENWISQEHNVSFQHNSTAELHNISIPANGNVSVNTTYDTDVISKSAIINADASSTFTINSTIYNLTQNISVDAHNAKLDLVGINLTVWLLSYFSDIYFNNTLNISIYDTDIINFSTPSVPANTTLNFTLNWTGQASHVFTDPTASGICISTTTKEYTKTDIVEIMVNSGIHQRTFDLSLVPSFASRIVENFTATNASGNSSLAQRTFDATNYFYNITPNGTGNYTAKIMYTVNDATCGGGGGGGGGGSSSSLSITQQITNASTLTITPYMIEGVCFGRASKGITCTNTARANKALSSCTPTGTLPTGFTATCTILDDYNIKTTISAANMTAFTQKVTQEFILQVKGSNEVGRLYLDRTIINLSNTWGISIFIIIATAIIVAGLEIQASSERKKHRSALH